MNMTIANATAPLPSGGEKLCQISLINALPTFHISTFADEQPY